MATATIASYPVLDFSGGVRRDVGQSQMDRNELLDARNVHLDERGRIRTRLGSQQLGQTLTGTIENSFFYTTNVSGVHDAVLLVNNSANPAVVSMLRGAVLTAAASVGDTTLTVNDTTQFTASGTIEIEGDLIAYTATPSATSITGVTGISAQHAIGAPVHQWSTLTQSGTGVNGITGITYAVLNQICFFGGTGANMKQLSFAASVPTVSDVSGEPGVNSLTNYRDRLYGIADGSGSSAVIPRVYFSARGDGTSWSPTVDYFAVEDKAGQYLTGLKVHSDTMGIFKATKIYTYDEIELKERIPDVGAYNQKVIQSLGGNLFTFCENGIFVTNLFSAKSIGEPVKEFFRGFVPTYETGNSIFCTNTHAWVSEKSYFLYINDITVPTVTNDVVLEYNTETKTWTVHDGGYTNFFHVNNFPEGRFGASANPILVPQHIPTIRRPCLIAGDSGGKVWRMEENRLLNASNAVFGSDIFVDLRSDTGTPISSVVETQMYDLTHPELFKKFKHLRVYTESGQWNFEYRVEDEHGISSYRSLGTVSTTNQVLNFPSEAQGWRCGFRISGVSSNAQRIFNGFIFENTEVLPRP